MHGVPRSSEFIIHEFDLNNTSADALVKGRLSVSYHRMFIKVKTFFSEVF